MLKNIYKCMYQIQSVIFNYSRVFINQNLNMNQRIQLHEAVDLTINNETSLKNQLNENESQPIHIILRTSHFHNHTDTRHTPHPQHQNANKDTEFLSQEDFNPQYDSWTQQNQNNQNNQLKQSLGEGFKKSIVCNLPTIPQSSRNQYHSRNFLQIQQDSPSLRTHSIYQQFISDSQMYSAVQLKQVTGILESVTILDKSSDEIYQQTFPLKLHQGQNEFYKQNETKFKESQKLKHIAYSFQSENKNISSLSTSGAGTNRVQYKETQERSRIPKRKIILEDEASTTNLPRKQNPNLRLSKKQNAEQQKNLALHKQLDRNAFAGKKSKLKKSNSQADYFKHSYLESQKNSRIVNSDHWAKAVWNPDKEDKQKHVLDSIAIKQSSFGEKKRENSSNFDKQKNFSEEIKLLRQLLKEQKQQNQNIIKREIQEYVEKRMQKYEQKQTQIIKSIIQSERLFYESKTLKYQEEVLKQLKQLRQKNNIKSANQNNNNAYKAEQRQKNVDFQQKQKKRIQYQFILKSKLRNQ